MTEPTNKKWLLASNNQGKLNELQALLIANELGVELIPLKLVMPQELVAYLPSLMTLDSVCPCLAMPQGYTLLAMQARVIKHCVIRQIMRSYLQSYYPLGKLILATQQPKHQ